MKFIKLPTKIALAEEIDKNEDMGRRVCFMQYRRDTGSSRGNWGEGRLLNILQKWGFDKNNFKHR